jgi:hypothetical protein
MFILIYKTTWDDSEKTFFLQSDHLQLRDIYIYMKGKHITFTMLGP